MKLGEFVRSPWRLAVAGALLLLLINAAGYFLVTHPRQQRSRRAEELSAALAKVLDEERTEVERLRVRARVIEANRRDAKRFFSETIRPQREALADDLDALEEAFRQARLLAERRSYRRAEEADLPLVRIDHQIAVSGPRDRVAAFLGLIERSPRFILVSGIKIRQEASGSADLDATLATFYRSEEQASTGQGTRRASAPRRR